MRDRRTTISRAHAGARFAREDLLSAACNGVRYRSIIGAEHDATKEGAMPHYNGINFVDSEGAGVPIVLVHGFCCDHTDWDRLRHDLGSSYRTVALDLRGHGASDSGGESIEALAEDVADLVESESLDGAVLVGHSLGCRVVLEANRRLSAHVRGLVLVDGSKTATTPDAAPQMRAAVNEVGFETFTESFFGQMFTDKAAPETVKAIVDRARTQNAETALNLFVDMVSWDATRFESALEAAWAPILAIQTTFLNSDRQRVAMREGESTEYTSFLESGFQNPDSRIEVIADTGHFPQIEESERLATLLSSFVES